MDVKTAFLNGKLKDKIYMKIPVEVNGRNNQVYKLNKSIYGFKQAARCWLEEFENVLNKKVLKVLQQIVVFIFRIKRICQKIYI